MVERSLCMREALGSIPSISIIYIFFRRFFSFSPSQYVTQGNIGILDAGTRSYATLIRSHTQSINSACLDSRGLHLITCSTDNTIRVWDTTSGEQVKLHTYSTLAS